MQEFQMAYDDGVDVITCSIGTVGGFSDDVWAVFASRLVERGIVVTIAAGNDGDSGPFYADSGSSGADVLAVASVLSTAFPGLGFNATFSLNGVVNKTMLAYAESDADTFPPSVMDLPI